MENSLDVNVPDGALVYFALSEAADGRVLNTGRDYDTYGIIEINFWRWGSTPELIAEVSPTGPSAEWVKWLPAAFGEDGKLFEDAERLHQAFELQKSSDGEFFGPWFLVAAGDDVGAIDGYSLGTEATAKLGVELNPEREYGHRDPNAAETLVYFALGEGAGGRAVGTEGGDYDSDELLEISVWRWAEKPEQIAVFLPDSDYTWRVKWLPAALNPTGELREDLRELEEGLNFVEPDGEFIDPWDVVSGVSNGYALDGYYLDAEDAALVGIELAPEDWYAQRYPEEVAEQARLDEESAREDAARAAAKAAMPHTCLDPDSIQCSLYGKRVVFTATIGAQGQCVSCKKPETDGELLERLDDGAKSGVMVCKACWAKVLKASSFHQRYSNSPHFHSFNILPDGASPENCCARPAAPM